MEKDIWNATDKRSRGNLLKIGLSFQFIFATLVTALLFILNQQAQNRILLGFAINSIIVAVFSLFSFYWVIEQGKLLANQDQMQDQDPTDNNFSRSVFALAIILFASTSIFFLLIRVGEGNILSTVAATNFNSVASFTLKWNLYQRWITAGSILILLTLGLTISACYFYCGSDNTVRFQIYTLTILLAFSCFGIIYGLKSFDSIYQSGPGTSFHFATLAYKIVFILALLTIILGAFLLLVNVKRYQALYLYIGSIFLVFLIIGVGSTGVLVRDYKALRTYYSNDWRNQLNYLPQSFLKKNYGCDKYLTTTSTSRINNVETQTTSYVTDCQDKSSYSWVWEENKGIGDKDPLKNQIIYSNHYLGCLNQNVCQGVLENIYTDYLLTTIGFCLAYIFVIFALFGFCYYISRRDQSQQKRTLSRGLEVFFLILTLSAFLIGTLCICLWSWPKVEKFSEIKSALPQSFQNYNPQDFTQYPGQNCFYYAGYKNYINSLQIYAKLFNSNTGLLRQANCDLNSLTAWNCLFTVGLLITGNDGYFQNRNPENYNGNLRIFDFSIKQANDFITASGQTLTAVPAAATGPQTTNKFVAVQGRIGDIVDYLQNTLIYCQSAAISATGTGVLDNVVLLTPYSSTNPAPLVAPAAALNSHLRAKKLIQQDRQVKMNKIEKKHRDNHRNLRQADVQWLNITVKVQDSFTHAAIHDATVSVFENGIDYNNGNQVTTLQINSFCQVPPAASTVPTQQTQDTDYLYFLQPWYRDQTDEEGKIKLLNVEMQKTLTSPAINYAVVVNHPDYKVNCRNLDFNLGDDNTLYISLVPNLKKNQVAVQLEWLNNKNSNNGVNNLDLDLYAATTDNTGSQCLVSFFNPSCGNIKYFGDANPTNKQSETILVSQINIYYYIFFVREYVTIEAGKIRQNLIDNSQNSANKQYWNSDLLAQSGSVIIKYFVSELNTPAEVSVLNLATNYQTTAALTATAAADTSKILSDHQLTYISQCFNGDSSDINTIQKKSTVPVVPATTPPTTTTLTQYGYLWNANIDQTLLQRPVDASGNPTEPSDDYPNPIACQQIQNLLH